jgi:C-terminal processing protease CtpA/Prc
VAPDGVQPDVEVAGAEDPASEDDPQLDRAVEVLLDD